VSLAPLIGFSRFPRIPQGESEAARRERERLVREAEENQARLKREMYERLEEQ